MRIFSYNVNGIRAAINKGFLDWLNEESPDVVCLQEVKALESQVNLFDFQSLGYEVFWNAAQKKGYSGVAVLTKSSPENVSLGMGVTSYDMEGRILRVDFDQVSVVSAYFPSGTSGEERQNFKMEFLNDFLIYSRKLRQERPRLVLCCDYKICHQSIDIHDPVGNKKSSGFLPEEREWMTNFIEDGFIDTFREKNKEPHQYTWWSFRHNAREQNKGWRIDYHMVTDNLFNRIAEANIHPNVKHSDHCPIELVLEIPTT